MQFWGIQTLNSFALGGLLFLLSSGFSLIFGLMRVPNLAHGAFFMLGAYVGITTMDLVGGNFWLGVLGGGLAVAVLGGLLERFILRRLAGNEQGQVLVTLGFAFIIADLSLVAWGGDPITVRAPSYVNRPLFFAGLAFPTYRFVVLAAAVIMAIALHLIMDRTRLGAMIRAGVDDMQMARGIGIRVSQLFTIVFCLGAALAGIGGVMGGPITTAYPGLDSDMLPLALIVVILGGIGSLLGAFVGSFAISFIYNFGIALFPDLAYVILFLPMVLVLVWRPQGLFGRLLR